MVINGDYKVATLALVIIALYTTCPDVRDMLCVDDCTVTPDLLLFYVDTTDL